MFTSILTKASCVWCNKPRDSVLTFHTIDEHTLPQIGVSVQSLAYSCLFCNLKFYEALLFFLLRNAGRNNTFLL